MDAVFRAKVLDTHGVDTKVQVIEVVKGDVPQGKVVFKHAHAPKEPSLEDGRHYYVLTTGQTYLIYANRTGRKNVFTQLHSDNHCGSSVVLIQP